MPINSFAKTDGRYRIDSEATPTMLSCLIKTVKAVIGSSGQRLGTKHFKLTHFEEFIVIKHSVNVVFLLGETFLNSLWFPLFRISYFVLWTGVFVILQWIVHACVSWYAAVGLMHVPCFGVFALIVKLKYMWFSKCFSEEP
ncbi:hypothetical protein F2Q68_00006158 [Brassica cretica]|uniref:Uncharacterized protein n=1 Tax=Brassica cretica TaxID=69181 RepID=A0A8S9JFM0_BRACR|nr:hypothetical protein F2Q68_00006158 [Brassica cretica]